MKKLLLFLLIPFGLTAQNFWTEVSPFSGDYQYTVSDISIVSEEVIWIHGTDAYPAPPQWSRSVDGGLTWESGDINLEGANVGICTLHAISANRAYVAGFANDPTQTGGVWATNDGGATWTQQLGQNWAPGTQFVNFVHFWNSNDGIAVCDPTNNGFEIYTTTDAGVNWTLVPAANIPAPLLGEYGYTRCFDDANGNFWFGTNKGRVFYTNASNLAGGLTWQVFQTPLSDFGSASASGEFAFKNQNEGLLAATDFSFWRTIDSGANWSQEFPTGVQRNFTLTHVTGTNSYFATGEDTEQFERGSSYSTDGGHNWINLNEDEEAVFPQEVAFASGTVGFCVGTYLSDMNGTKRFFRMTDPLNRLLKTSAFNGKPSFTATPNPTKDLVKISGENIKTVQICDLSGKAIATQNFDALDEVALDLSALQTGIYLAKIHTKNDVSDTVKIIKQ